MRKLKWIWDNIMKQILSTALLMAGIGLFIWFGFWLNTEVFTWVVGLFMLLCFLWMIGEMSGE